MNHTNAKMLINRDRLRVIGCASRILSIRHYALTVATKRKMFNLQMSISTMEYLGWPLGLKHNAYKKITTLSLGKILFRLDVF